MSRFAGVSGVSQKHARRHPVPLPSIAVAAWISLYCPIPETVSAQPADFHLEELSIADLQRAMDDESVTSRRLVELYLERIQRLDRDGPCLNSIIETNPEALSTAEEMDRERRGRGPRGPLHGIPILLKDNIDTADRMLTTAGSLALADSRPARDAFLVSRLRAAGAVIIGKTNLSEWANFRSTKSSSGWSGRGGQTRCPYALDRNPSGSSSGSAVAVASNLAAVAVGTETDGSIVSPASVCGIVGLKPTVGRVSRAGVIPIAHSQDTAGPMTRCVADAALLLGAMAGADPADPATSAASSHAQLDYARFLDKDGLRGARVGVVRSDAFHLSGKVTPILDSAVEAMKRAGAVVVDNVEIANLGKATDDAEFEVLLYEFKADLERYLATRPGAAATTLAGLIAFDREHAGREMPFFGQEIFEQAAEKGPLAEPAYIEALGKSQRLMREGIDAAIAKHRLDALVAITNGPAHLTDLVNGDAYTGGSSSPAAVAGYPSITVPAGFVHGLPVGVSFFGKAWSEPALIRLAYAFEQATRARRMPGFRPTAELADHGCR
ncbi:MAG: amidase [Acidobacteriota bacterium]